MEHCTWQYMQGTLVRTAEASSDVYAFCIRIDEDPCARWDYNKIEQISFDFEYSDKAVVYVVIVSIYLIGRKCTLY